MRGQRVRKFMADFETLTQPRPDTGQVEVWAAAIVELIPGKIEPEFVMVDNSINGFYSRLQKIRDESDEKHRREKTRREKKQKFVVYFHNLDFDSRFILWDLLQNKHYSVVEECEKDYELKLGEMSCIISDMTTYSITIRLSENLEVELRDSLNLISGTVREIGENWKTKYRKGLIDYDGHSKAGEEITTEEEAYIKNDVLVVAEVLTNLMTAKTGDLTKKLTIAGGAFLSMKDFLARYFDPDGSKDCKNAIDRWHFVRETIPQHLPDLTSVETGEISAHEFTSKAYRGGWCFVAPEKAGKTLSNGSTYDVNSLYPSVMLSGTNPSGVKRVYPIGSPIYREGSAGIERFLKSEKYYVFLKLHGHFSVKPGFLPMIQLPDQFYLWSRYGTRQLKRPLYYNRDYIFNSRSYRNPEAGEAAERGGWAPTFYLTETDYQLFQRHYDTSEIQIESYIVFRACIGIFDGYVGYWGKLKQECDKADPMRNIAKLMLNSAYGKFGTKAENISRIPFIDGDGLLQYKRVESTKDAVYMPLAAAITAYARDFTITAAQKNYHGGNPGFAYADTDSIHCDLPADQVVGVEVDGKKFGCWDNEFNWKTGKFLRPKTYLEFNESEIIVRACGLNKPLQGSVGKALGFSKVNGKSVDDVTLTTEYDEFTVDSFQEGLSLPHKLTKKNVRGGVILVDTEFTIKQNH